jgi:ADP-ribosyl-[dinitrogen reductase] hydrolase
LTRCVFHAGAPGAFVMGDVNSGLIHDSVNSPLRIDWVAVPAFSGRIGMTLCPGKQQMVALSGPWARDLELDLQVITAAGARAIVTLLEEHEFAILGVPQLPQMLAQRFAWYWLPIPDGGVPDAGFEQRWRISGTEIRERLERGEKVVVHCRAGLGRTGTIAARLLMEFGMDARSALVAVRSARSGTVETPAQERYLLELGGRVR